MNPRQHLYLDLMAEKPQTFRAFLPVVVGVTTISPGRAMSLLEKMIEGGYCELSRQGTFTITTAGRRERLKAQTSAERKQERKKADVEPGPITPPRTFVNASTPSSDPYTGEVRGYQRETANKLIRSRGF